jgi:hypothetical protein
MLGVRDGLLGASSAERGEPGMDRKTVKTAASLGREVFMDSTGLRGGNRDSDIRGDLWKQSGSVPIRVGFIGINTDELG